MEASPWAGAVSCCVDTPRGGVELPKVALDLVSAQPSSAIVGLVALGKLSVTCSDDCNMGTVIQVGEAQVSR